MHMEMFNIARDEAEPINVVIDGGSITIRLAIPHPLGGETSFSTTLDPVTSGLLLKLRKSNVSNPAEFFDSCLGFYASAQADFSTKALAATLMMAGGSFELGSRLLDCLQGL